MSKSLWAHLGLLFANLIYGANHTIAKEVMPKFVQPFGFIVLRVSGAFVLFLISYYFLKDYLSPLPFTVPLLSPPTLLQCSFLPVF